MNRRFDAIDANLQNMANKEEMGRILNRLDSIEKQLEISQDERLVMGRQLDRLNLWVEKIADRIGYRLAT